jgi:capsular exopolysaccharide synthesis family protein
MDPQDSTQNPAETVELSDYLRVIRERKWIIIITVVVVVGAAMLATFRATSLYRATAQLLYQSTNLDAAFLGTPLYRSAQQERDVQTGAQLVKLENVADKVKLSIASPRSPEALLGMVSVEPQSQTDVVRITAVSDDAAEAAAVANAFAYKFVEARTAQARSAVVDALGTVEKKVAALPAAEKKTGYGLMLTDKLEQLHILESLQTGGFNVVQVASAPRVPFSPKPLRNGVLALAVGLVLGVGLAFLFEYLDRRIKNEEFMERAFGLPVLASVPMVGGRWLHSEGKRSDAPVGFPSDRSPLLEPFRVLRSNLQYFDLDHRLRVILITSALPQEGKTVTAANLAFSLAISGARVILVDADLRKPMLHNYLGLDNEIGLTSALAGSHTVTEAFQLVQAENFVSTDDDSAPRPGLTNLQKNIYVLTSGPLPPNPAELVGSSRMEDLLAYAVEVSDYVIVDSPPVLLVADALSLSKQADGVILTARIGHTTTDEAAEARQLLERVGAKMVGIVAGGAKEGKGYSRYGRRGHGYRYGHTYYANSEG